MRSYFSRLNVKEHNGLRSWLLPPSLPPFPFSFTSRSSPFLPPSPSVVSLVSLVSLTTLSPLPLLSLLFDLTLRNLWFFLRAVWLKKGGNDSGASEKAGKGKGNVGNCASEYYAELEKYLGRGEWGEFFPPFL